MTTTANNYIEVDKKKICAITPKEYNELTEYDKIYNLPQNFIKNHINNYEEFGDNPESTLKKMAVGCKNEDIEKILLNYKDKGHSIGIITARSIDSESMASFMKQHFQVDIPSDHIIAIANKKRFDKVIDDLKKFKENNPFLKANWNNLSLSLDSTNIAEKKQLAMVWFISKNYKNISFYDDDPANIQIMNQLKEKLQKIDSNLFSIQAHEVSVEQRAKCKKIIDEKMLQDEQYQKLKLSGDMCKHGLQMLHQKEK